MDFGRAIDAHVLWRTKIRTAIKERTALDVVAISDDHRCALGQWLHGEGRDSAGPAARGHLTADHAQFHRAAGAIASRVNEADYAAAEQMLRPGSEFADASSRVIGSIAALKRGKPGGD